jgi:hypothetical protein
VDAEHPEELPKRAFLGVVDSGRYDVVFTSSADVLLLPREYRKLVIVHLRNAERNGGTTFRE